MILTCFISIVPVNKWASSHKRKFLGVPAYIGSGCHETGGSKFRFMIMERFGEDVDQIFAKCGKQFHIQTVLTLAIRIVSLKVCNMLFLKQFSNTIE